MKRFIDWAKRARLIYLILGVVLYAATDELLHLVRPHAPWKELVSLILTLIEGALGKLLAYIIFLKAPSDLERLDALLKEVERSIGQKVVRDRITGPGENTLTVRWKLATLKGIGSDHIGHGLGNVKELPGLEHTMPREEGTVEQLGVFFGSVRAAMGIVAGGAGVGKSHAGAMVAWDFIQRCKADTTRSFPIPLLLRLTEWNAMIVSHKSPKKTVEQTFESWLRHKIAVEYNNWDVGQEKLNDFLRQGRFVLILDSLDEASQEQQRAIMKALSAFSETTDMAVKTRIMLLSRPEALTANDGSRYFHSATAVQLLPVGTYAVTKYLNRLQFTGNGWDRVFRELREQNTSPVARVLSTPLYLSILGHIAQQGSLDAAKFYAPQAGEDAVKRGIELENYLIDEYITYVFANPARAYGWNPNPSFSRAQAIRTLGFMAACMIKTRDVTDLAWWDIPYWLPSGVWGKLKWALLGTLPVLYVFDRMAYYWSAGAYLSRSGIIHWLGLGVGGLLLCVELLFPAYMALVLLIAFTEDDSRQAHRIAAQTPACLSRFSLGRFIRKFIVYACGFIAAGVSIPGAGVVLGYVVGRHTADYRQLLQGMPTWVALTVIAGVLFGFVKALTKSDPTGATYLEPKKMWRRHRLSAFTVALFSALAMGLMLLLVRSLRLYAPLPGILIISESAAIGLAVWVLCDRTITVFIAAFVFRLWGLTSTIRLLPLLETAYNHDILRTSGSLYRFSHISLQLRLASKYTETTPGLYIALEYSPGVGHVLERL